MEMGKKTGLQLNYMERLAKDITVKLNSKLNKDGIELQKLNLGVEIILINLSKFIIIIGVAYYFNLLKEVLLMIIVFSSLRKRAFGLHAKNSVVCTMTSLIVFVFGSYISYYLKFNNYVIVTIFTIINILLYKYAPADTEVHPLLNLKLRKKLKKEAMLTGTFLMLVALLIPSQAVKTMIALSAISQVISTLPITYKILNRGYKNYEKFERGLI